MACLLLALSTLAAANAGCASRRPPLSFPTPTGSTIAASDLDSFRESRDPRQQASNQVQASQVEQAGFEGETAAQLKSNSLDPPDQGNVPNQDLVQFIPSDDQEPDGKIELDRIVTAYQSDVLPTGAKLSLDDVLTSVCECYPQIEIAIGEIESAQGKVLASWGEFDSVFGAHSISQPLGFYQTYRNGIGLTRPLYQGGSVYGTYRIGDGNFEPWYGERETNEGGEFKTGFKLPLLKDRGIDQRRANMLSANAQRDQVEANVDSRLLQFERFATQAFWDWVAAGQAVQIQDRLLKLALKRVDQISTRVEEGDLARIAEIDNDRFIASRRTSLIQARRLLEKTAIKLSLFYRDANCAPVIVPQDSIPELNPVWQRIENDRFESDLANALALRPELTELAAARREACIDLQYAKNLTLAKIDMIGFAAQDVGGAASSKRDKTPFQLQLGVLAEVPIQRREGCGKIQTAQGKLLQIDSKIRFSSEKIRAEIQDAASAVNAAFDQINQSSENVRLARRSLELGRISFEEGDIDLIALNIYETAVADAELKLLSSQLKYFVYRANYDVAVLANGIFGSE